MKIRVFIADSDQRFYNEVINRLRMTYLNEFEIRYFTQAELLTEELKIHQPDVLLVSEEILGTTSFKTYTRTKFAVLTSQQLETCGGFPAICKYQTPEVLCKEIVNLFSELGNEEKEENSKRAKIISFYGLSGGVGSSTMAASLAKKLAKDGHSVLYLNLESLSSTEAFFPQSETEVGSFDEVLLALKVRGMDFESKASGVMQQDPSGVRFFLSESSFIDMLDLNQKDTDSLLKEFVDMREFEYIVIDGDFYFDGKMRAVCKRSNHIFFVTKNEDMYIYKMNRFLESLPSFEERENDRMDIQSKAFLIYNFADDLTAENPNFPETIHIKTCDNKNPKTVSDVLADSGEFSRLAELVD